jgi:hypothetical protein
MLFYIIHQRGKMMKGEVRDNMYQIYRYFKGDRDASMCSCLDRDTYKKVDGFIDSYTWSDDTRKSDRFRDIFPHLALIKEELEIPLEIEPNQPVSVDMEKLAKVLEQKAKPVPIKPVKKVKGGSNGRTK